MNKIMFKPIWSEAIIENTVTKKRSYCPVGYTQVVLKENEVIVDMIHDQFP